MEDHLRKIGFFGGSFNPIHNGHLNLAIAVLEQLKLDRVFLCPNNESPFDKQAVQAHHRYEMVCIACKEYPQIKPCDLEIKRGGKSFTIDTLQKLSICYPQAEIRLIIADELISDFPRWKEYESIISDYRPIIATRHGLKNPHLPGFEEIQTPIMEISSTNVRLRIHNGLICAHLLPYAVNRYIQQHQLYHAF